MGRRSLRKIDPQLDLSRHYFEWAAAPRPLPLDDWLAPTGPLEIEIGSGKGLFLEHASGSRPGHRFVGIELAGKYARFAAARLAKASRTNALVVHGDAFDVLREGLPASSAHAVHIYFPDPWWKKRHHKRRIMNEPFIDQVVRILQPGGELHFWTDVQEYFQLGLELLQRFQQLEGPHPVPPAEPQHDLDYRTHFERRVRLAGLPVYRSQFTRRSMSG